MSDAPQLSLFRGAAGPDPAGPGAVVTPAQRALAARLSPRLHLGTSSWTFPGWAGLVYAGRPSKERLVDRGLEAYARHPLLRTVGVDRSYYASLRAEEWRGYAAQLPEGFRVVAKATSEVTTAVFPDHPRLGARAGRPNPRFLDPRLALDEVARPYLAGPARRVPDERGFALGLDRLLAAMPRELAVAVELRTPQLFTPRYLEVLARRGASHVLNFWGAMPSLAEQAALGADAVGARVVLRLMLPPGADYEALKARYAPFDRLAAPQPRMRTDALAIIRRAIDAARDTFVIANNKAEGCAPLTLFALAEALGA